MRHAAAWYEGMPGGERSRDVPELTKAGVAGTVAVAGRLAELIAGTGGDPSAVAVYDVGTPQSRATAALVRGVLGAPEPRKPSLAALSPDRLATYTADADDVRDAWEAGAARIDRAGRAIVVGHEPQVSWLLHHVGGQAVRWHTLVTGELALLEPNDDGRRARYVLSPADDTTADELRAKIRSKMDTAKVLGAVLTALLTFAATRLLDRGDLGGEATALAVTGLALLGAATALYVVTLFFYDGLLLPKRFWPAQPPGATSAARAGDDDHVLRPPGSEAWVLYQNMLRVWDRAFVPATWLAGAGVVALAVAFTDPSGWWWLVPLPVIAAVAAAVVALARRARPRLGVND
jgi:phosphohistidine phosphatase SixA